MRAALQMHLNFDVQLVTDVCSSSYAAVKVRRRGGRLSKVIHGPWTALNGLECLQTAPEAD